MSHLPVLSLPPPPPSADAVGAWIDRAPQRRLDPRLHAAVEDDRLDVVQWLLAQGEDVHCRNSEGETPLHRAARCGYLPLVRFLVEDAKADPASHDEDRQTPLHAAADAGQLPVIKYLLTRPGVDVNAKDATGATPLCCAVGSYHPGTVMWLLCHGKASMAVKVDRSNLLHLAASNLTGHDTIVRFLYLRGVWADERDARGRTPLHVAAGNSRLAIVRYLVNTAHAHCSYVDADGYTPLHSAAAGGCLAVARFLYKKARSCIIMKDKKGRTPLEVAVAYGRDDVAHSLGVWYRRDELDLDVDSD